MYDLASSIDEQILNDLLKEERYEILNSYDIHVALFVKYGKRDKEGNLKTPALTKNGIAIPAQIKLVSNFNRITDDTDVKIILNAEYWEELSKDEKIGVLDNMLAYIQIKEDKEGEPLTISESCDKVQLKLKHPDFYCEGFLDMLNLYKKNYLPWQDAANIAEKVDATKPEMTVSSEDIKEESVEEVKEVKKTVKAEKKEKTEKKAEDISTTDLLDEVLNN